MKSIASRLWPERIRVTLFPDRACATRSARYWPSRIVRRETGTGGVAGLAAALGALDVPRARVEVRLSNRFARYLCLPWSTALRTEADWHSFTEHRFTELFGVPAGGHAILLSSAASRSPRLACALEHRLIETIREAVTVAGYRVASLRPRFAAAFNHSRRHIDSTDTWFVDHEPGQLTIGLARNGEWRAIHQRQCDDAWHQHLSDVLDRESELAGQGTAERVLVATSEPTNVLPLRVGRYEVNAIGSI